MRQESRHCLAGSLHVPKLEKSWTQHAKLWFTWETSWRVSKESKEKKSIFKVPLISTTWLTHRVIIWNLHVTSRLIVLFAGLPSEFSAVHVYTPEWCRFAFEKVIAFPNMVCCPSTNFLAPCFHIKYKNEEQKIENRNKNTHETERTTWNRTKGNFGFKRNR